MEEKLKQSGFGITSLVLGILGICLSCVAIGVFPAILGLVFGLIGIFLKNRKKGLAIAGLVCSIVGIMFFFVMADFVDSVFNGESENTTKEPESVVSKELGSEEETKNKEEVAQKEQEECGFVGVGESIENDGLKITVNEADADFQDYENEYGWNTPQEGMKYVMVSFTFENNGDSDAYVSIYDFTCYADNSNCEQSYGLDDSDFVNTNLSAGRNVSFKTYYSVPIDAQSIELEYETDFWTGEKAVIKIE